ncbi:MAG: SpoIIE family protein phosphatase [Sphingobacteriaceae bacterium]|nr:SpoIIE family protein phosphatase [Sphingobacteriaceae bacterium]
MKLQICGGGGLHWSRCARCDDEHGGEFCFQGSVLKQKIEEPGLILQALDEELEKSFSKNSNEPFNDGMDVGLIQMNKQNNELKFSGAFRSIIVANVEGITEFRGSRYPLGFYSGVDKVFDTTTVQLQKGNCVYLYTDGYVDQFGGQNNKKLNKVNFKELIKTASEMEIDEQEAFLEYSFNNWKQDEEQTDDVLVIGVRV